MTLQLNLLHDDTTHVAPALSQSFIEIWKRHHETLYTLCIRWLGGRRDEADEAIGRTAVQAYEHCPPFFADAEHAKAWLLALAHNVCVDIHRERHRRRELSLETLLSVPAAPLSGLLIAASDPERSLLLVERNSMLRTSVRMLPPRLRDAVSMHYFEEMRCADIARRLGTSEQNVRKCIQLGRDALRHGISKRPGARRQTNKPRPRAVRVFRVADDRGEPRDVRLVVDPSDESPGRIARAERYLAKYQSGSAGRLALARALAAAGRFEEAVPHYQAVTAKSPYPLSTWLELGALLEALGRRDEAIETYLDGSNRAGRDADRLHLFGRAASLRGLRDPAVASLRKAAEEEPSNAIHLRALGETLLRFDDPIAALSVLQRAGTLDSGDPLTPMLIDDAMRLVAEQASNR